MLYHNKPMIYDRSMIYHPELRFLTYRSDSSFRCSIYSKCSYSFCGHFPSVLVTVGGRSVIMQDSRSLPKETSSQDSRDRWTKTGLIATCPLFGLLSTSERCWSTAIVAFIVPIPIFLMGFTFAFASSATLDLTGDATELPPGYILPTHLISIFVVSGVCPVASRVVLVV